MKQCDKIETPQETIDSKLMDDLKQGDVHIWFVRPKEIQSEELLHCYQQLLSKKELEKQQRYVFAEDRHDALITRAFIRKVLSQYILIEGKHIEAKEILFSIGDKGKPQLDLSEYPDQRLKFNISHTRDLIICALCLDNEIGCDVEQIARNSDILSIAHRFFSKSETKELFSLAGAQQRDRFFDYWTLKESYIKAWGLGLSIPLDQFSFNFQQDFKSGDFQRSDIQLSFSESREDDPDHWQSWLCYPSVDYRIAVSIHNPFANTVSDSIISEKIKVLEFKSEDLPNQGIAMTVEQFCNLDLRCSEQQTKVR